MKQLILPLTYEEINNHFQSSERDSKMMEFVSPLTNSEQELSLIASSITTSGKLAFILGNPGIGKSTFLHTLNWRSHVPIRKVVDIDANNFINGDNFDSLYTEISNICQSESTKNDKGICSVVINYLEYVDEYSDEIVKSFFRRLNGLLRNKPVLILWPVISRIDVDKMISFSTHVSGTLYQRDRAIVELKGPKVDDYVDIAIRTIKVLNDGAELSDFGLTHDDIVESFDIFLNQVPIVDQNIREFYSRIVSKWEQSSKYLEDLKLKIPKPTEVWFVFPFKDAESIVNQFSRKGNRIDDAWTAVSDKFSDYITGNTQRSAKWTSTRLQLALHGAIKTRIMYIPTNLVITTSAAFSENVNLKTIISKHSMPNHWNAKYQTKISIERSSIFKQLKGEPFPSGKRKGGPAVQALETADPVYKDLVTWISSGGGSDTHLNKAFATGLIAAGITNVLVEKEHPWIKSIYPDIQIDLGHKIVCIEFHYTYQDEPYIVADYTLKKLDAYMSQIESTI